MKFHYAGCVCDTFPLARLPPSVQHILGNTLRTNLERGELFKEPNQFWRESTVVVAKLGVLLMCIPCWETSNTPQSEPSTVTAFPSCSKANLTHITTMAERWEFTTEVVYIGSCGSTPHGENEKTLRRKEKQTVPHVPKHPRFHGRTCVTATGGNPVVGMLAHVHVQVNVQKHCCW